MLIPCAACRRHIETSETSCPFCNAPSDAKPISRTLLDGRFSRAAVFAGATVLAAPACVSNPPPQYQYQQQPNGPGPGDPNGPGPGDPNGPGPGDPNGSGGDPYRQGNLSGPGGGDPNAGDWSSAGKGDPNGGYAQPPPGDPPRDLTRPPNNPPPAVAPAIVRGRIVDAYGRPYAGVQVQLAGADGTRPYYTTADRNGSYVIRDITPGEYTLTVGVARSSGRESVPSRMVLLQSGKEAVVDLTATPYVRSNIPKPYGAPPARRRTV